jgi:hypothetical protein
VTPVTETAGRVVSSLTWRVAVPSLPASSGQEARSVWTPLVPVTVEGVQSLALMPLSVQFQSTVTGETNQPCAPILPSLMAG